MFTCSICLYGGGGKMGLPDEETNRKRFWNPVVTAMQCLLSPTQTVAVLTHVMTRYKQSKTVEGHSRPLLYLPRYSHPPTHSRPNKIDNIHLRHSCSLPPPGPRVHGREAPAGIAGGPPGADGAAPAGRGSHPKKGLHLTLTSTHPSIHPSHI